MTDMTTQANSLELIAITYADGDDAGDAQVSRGPPSALSFLIATRADTLGTAMEIRDGKGKGGNYVI